MKGYLTQTLGEWMVKNEDGEKLYPLCPISKNWSKRDQTQKFLKEGVEVVFEFIIEGEYCETKEEMVKKYFAKIMKVEHSSMIK